MNRHNRYRDKGEPKNLTSAEARLRQVAKDTGQEERRLRHRLGVAVLADILADLPLSERDERLLIKGGTAMMLRFGLERSRFSKDLDAMLRGQIDPFIERLRERGRTPHHGWTCTVAKVETIEVPGIASKPRRAAVKLAFKGRPYSTIQLEVAPEEAGAADEYDVTTAEDLAEIGFDAAATVQQVMTVRYQAAQKLHACSTPRSDGKPNDRAHDLVDLALLEDYIRDDLTRARDACTEIFDVRASTPWPPIVTAEESWPSQYTKATEGLEGVVPDTVDEAIALVNALVQDVAHA